jgi:hypothetical protein
MKNFLVNLSLCLIVCMLAVTVSLGQGAGVQPCTDDNDNCVGTAIGSCNSSNGECVPKPGFECSCEEPPPGATSCYCFGSIP